MKLDEVQRDPKLICSCSSLGWVEQSLALLLGPADLFLLLWPGCLWLLDLQAGSTSLVLDMWWSSGQSRWHLSPGLLLSQLMSSTWWLPRPNLKVSLSSGKSEAGGLGGSQGSKAVGFAP